MTVETLTVRLWLFLVCPYINPVFQQECWISSVTHGSPGQQNCFHSQFWMEFVRKGEIGTSEEGGDLHWLCLIQHFDCLLNCLAWERLIPKESFTFHYTGPLMIFSVSQSLFHSYCYLSVWMQSIKSLSLSIQTCWCAQFTYSLFSPFVGLKRHLFKK